MKPHPKLRKTIKWTGAAATVLMVVAWIGSGWWGAGWMGQRGDALQVAGGRVLWGHDGGMNFLEFNPGVHFGASNFKFAWWFQWLDNGRPIGHGSAWVVVVPLWALVLMMAFVTAVAWHLDTLAHRRAHAHHCTKCNYDRAGLVAGAACPECGSVPK
ncbi:MAG TPA: hypothetical protein PKE29_18735 [Phycisphaerales bacterium]|nr:hypothetical protein [Phycisphaerales bacterium]